MDSGVSLAATCIKGRWTKENFHCWPPRINNENKVKWIDKTDSISWLFYLNFFILFTEFCPKFFSVQMILCSVRLRYKIWKRIFSLPEFCSIICRTGLNSGKGGGCQGENINEMLQSNIPQNSYFMFWSPEIDVVSITQCRKWQDKDKKIFSLSLNI